MSSPLTAVTDPVIQAKDLWFAFGGHPVLTGVNFTVRRNEFLAMIGPNGGGKTTLMKLMLGLLTPGRGWIRVLGQKPRHVSRRVGYVPQDIHINTSFPISVMDVVLMGRLRSGGCRARTRPEDRQAALKALDRVDMADYSKRRIGELSGGQCQRVFVARALVTNPNILMLDEPTASIDTKGQTALYTILKTLNKHITIVVVTHDLTTISSYVESVACVNRQVHYHGSAEVTEQMLDNAYQCPVEVIAHGGIPHRVLRVHDDEKNDY